MKHLNSNLSLLCKACLLSIASLAINTPVLADHGHQKDRPDAHHPTAITNAQGKVIGEITDVVSQTQYRTITAVCDKEVTVPVRVRRKHCEKGGREFIAGISQAEAGMALIGGAAGSSIGGGNGKIAASVVGALVGAHVGGEIDKAGKRCRMVEEVVPSVRHQRVKCEQSVSVDGYLVHLTVDGKSQQIWFSAEQFHR